MRVKGFEVVGAKGFEPSTSWSRTSVAKILSALSGVASGLRTDILPLSIVRRSSVNLNDAILNSLANAIDPANIRSKCPKLLRNGGHCKHLKNREKIGSP